MRPNVPRVTELRLHPDYITYYWMWTRLFATGVIPLLVLALLNSKIYFSIRQSKQRLRSLAIRSALPMAILGTNPAVAAAAAAAASGGGGSNGTPTTATPSTTAVNSCNSSMVVRANGVAKNGIRYSTSPKITF